MSLRQLDALTYGRRLFPSHLGECLYNPFYFFLPDPEATIPFLLISDKSHQIRVYQRIIIIGPLSPVATDGYELSKQINLTKLLRDFDIFFSALPLL